MISPRIQEHQSRLPAVIMAGLGIMTGAGFVLIALTAFAVPQEDSESLDRSDDKLRMVAEAYLDVVEIQQGYSTKIQTASSTEEAQMLQQEANRESRRIVEEQDDLTVQEYSDTLNAARDDDDLWRELLAIVDVIREERAQEEREPSEPRR